MAATPQVTDFTNVKDGGDGNFRPRHVPDGDYVATVKAVEDHVSKAGNKQWVFTIVLDGRSSASYPYYCGFTEKEAWKIRNMLIAAGMQVPAKKVRVDPNKLVGKKIGVAMITEEYNDKEKSVIDAIFPPSDIQTTGKASGSSSSNNASDDTDDTTDEDLEIEDI